MWIAHTARKYIEAGKCPAELQAKHTWRTRPDPLDKVWEEVTRMLRDAPELEAKTLFEYFLARPDSGLEESHLRTFSRRVRHWRATQGPSTDNGPYLFYDLWINGEFFVSTGIERSITVEGLEPETIYTFAVRARDSANNFSPFSTPVTITTAAPGSVDTTPPTTPTAFTFTDLGCGNVILSWTQSTDNVTPQSNIRYDIYVDGFLDHSVVGVGSTTAFSGQNVDKCFRYPSSGRVWQLQPGQLIGCAI